MFKNIKSKGDIVSLEELDTVKKKDEKQLCSIYDSTDRMIKYRNISSDLIPLDSIPRYFNGAYRHFLEYKQGGTLRVIEPPREKKEADSPQTFAVILTKIATLVPKAVPMKSNIMEKVKITILIVFSFFELIILFFIVNSLSGGNV